MKLPDRTHLKNSDELGVQLCPGCPPCPACVCPTAEITNLSATNGFPFGIAFASAAAAL